jgi:hypothetical protein
MMPQRVLRVSTTVYELREIAEELLTSYLKAPFRYLSGEREKSL